MTAPVANSVLVTGATGFVGGHVARAFTRNGWHVAAAVRAGSARSRLAGLEALELIDLDLATPATVSGLFADRLPAGIVHCAAYGVEHGQQDADTAVAVNVRGTEALVEAAADAGVPRFIHVGTAYEYGPQDGPVTEDTPLRPRGLYATTKAEAARLALERAGANGLALVVVRPFGLYGPGENAGKFVPMLIDACRQDRVIELTPGDQVRDYAFVGDVAEAMVGVMAADPFPAGETYNLASGTAITLRDLGEAVQKAAGGGGTLAWGARPYRGDEIMTLAARTEKVAAALGWRATTGLDEGLRQTAAAYPMAPTMVVVSKP